LHLDVFGRGRFHDPEFQNRPWVLAGAQVELQAA